MNASKLLFPPSSGSTLLSGRFNQGYSQFSVLPLSLADIVFSPTPFMCGISSKMVNYIDLPLEVRYIFISFFNSLLLWTLQDLVMIDMDRGTVTWGPLIPALPEDQYATLMWRVTSVLHPRLASLDYVNQMSSLNLLPIFHQPPFGPNL